MPENEVIVSSYPDAQILNWILITLIIECHQYIEIQRNNQTTSTNCQYEIQSDQLMKNDYYSVELIKKLIQ